MNGHRHLIDLRLRDIPVTSHDVVVIGSGVAGLSCAYHLDEKLDVAVLTKTELSQTATRYAQGGIAVAIGQDDSLEAHIRDTLEAGRGLSDPEAVRVLVSEGPECIDELTRLGVPFDRAGVVLNLGLEAGHSRPRVVHTKDYTGSEVEAHLVDAVRRRPNLTVAEDVFVVDILTEDGRCRGVLISEGDRLSAFTAPVVVLAAGGMGQLFAVTTNPPLSTGDGLAMAYRAGAVLTDVEFIQFHPTALHMPGSPRFLISEAVRGEGAVIRDKNGERFLVDVYPEAELAPRDEVVRQMFLTMRATGEDHVYLDCRQIGEKRFRARFPAIHETLAEKGIDIARDLIPISPAAHYMSGGVKTDLQGKTNIAGLLACGEVACTGVHGANRLASNSLLEGLVFSRRTVAAAMDFLGRSRHREELKIDEHTGFADQNVDAGSEKERLREMMTRYGGVLRSEESLSAVFRYLEERKDVLEMGFRDAPGFELVNLMTLARAVNAACLTRQESRGSHWREDYPYEDDSWLKHILIVRDRDSMVVEIER